MSESAVPMHVEKAIDSFNVRLTSLEDKFDHEAEAHMRLVAEVGRTNVKMESVEQKIDSLIEARKDEKTPLATIVTVVSSVAGILGVALVGYVNLVLNFTDNMSVARHTEQERGIVAAEQRLDDHDLALKEDSTLLLQEARRLENLDAKVSRASSDIQDIYTRLLVVEETAASNKQGVLATNNYAKENRRVMENTINRGVLQPTGAVDGRAPGTSYRLN